MYTIHGEYQLHGLKDHEIIIKKIIEELNAPQIEFDIRLILTEGLSNAYKHGNKELDELPILLRYDYDGSEIVFEIEDSGRGSGIIVLPECIPGENILNDSGRGLFLINSFADSVNMIKNKLVIKKQFPSCLNN